MSRGRDIPKKSTWGRIVGNANRVIIPIQHLPTNCVILQRYHTLRTERSIERSFISLLRTCMIKYFTFGNELTSRHSEDLCVQACYSFFIFEGIGLSEVGD